MSKTHGFVNELFKGNTRNNYLHEKRKGQSIIHEKPVIEEPAFELFDATRPFTKSMDETTAVVSKNMYEWSFCRVRLPKHEKIDWGQAEAFTASLSSLKDVSSFETVYEDDALSFFLGSTHKRTLNALTHLFTKIYPGSVTTPCIDPLKKFETEHFFTLACHSYHQKVMFNASLYEQLSHQCRIQVLFTPVKNKWQDNIKEMLKAEKFTSNNRTSGKDVSKTLFAVNVRIGSDDKESMKLLSSLFGSIAQAGKPLTKVYEYQYRNIVGESINRMFQDRVSYTPGMLLTPDELSVFIHIPVSINTDFVKGYPVPELLKQGRPVGMNNHSVPTTVCMPDSENFKSAWYLGPPRCGKSTSLEHQVLYLAKSGGVHFIDPHRKTAKRLISLMPDELIERVVWLDHEDKDYVINFNTCDEDDPSLYGARTLDVVSSMENLFDFESHHRMKHLFRMAILSLFVLKKNISTIPLLFSDSKEGIILRKRVIAETNNAELRRFWKNEYATYSNDAFSPILNRLSSLFMDEHILRMFSQTKNSIRVDDFWNNSNIVIEALPTTSSVANTIGELGISQYHKAALGRNKDGVDYKEFHLVGDEFHRFKCSEIIESIVNETAKTGLHLCVANQTTKQLSEGILESVSSMKNIILFGMNPFDARRMKDLFNGEVSVNDLVSLPVGGCIAKISGKTIDFQGFSPLKGNPETAKKIIEHSRKHYYTPVSKLKIDKPIKRELDHF